MGDNRARVSSTRQVVAYVPLMVLRYVGESQGRASVRAVLEAAGLAALQQEEWTSLSRWWSIAEVLALAEAAGEQTGDLDIGRRAGEQLTRFLGETREWLPKSVRDAVEETLTGSNQMSPDTFYELLEPTRDGELLIEAHYADPSRTDRFFCSFIAGYYAAMPSLLGARAVVTEPECQFRGHDRCLFRLRWWGGPGGNDQARAKAASVSDMLRLARFEELQSMAAELVQAQDVSTVLERIAARASSALQAPRYVLAVRTTETDELRVHHLGFADDDSARDFAVRLLAGELTSSDGVAAVNITSARRCFGKLAAVFEPGVKVRGSDMRLLEAYAGHAAAALDVVSSFAAARRDRDAAEALLRLAHRLSGALSKKDIARWVAEAVPAVTGADDGAVWLWDGADELRLAADHDGIPRGRHAIAVPDALRLHTAAEPTPFWVHADDAGPDMGALLARQHLTAAALAPITPDGEAVGVLVAGFRSSPPDGAQADVVARLHGLSDHASMSFAHAGLVEVMRLQALHDALTGLPNRRLLEDRAEIAIQGAVRSGSGVALLFMDLDRFKVVNDTMGHAVGDQLIRAVAERLSLGVRSCDTLARLGGDEFVILATQLSAAGEVDAIADRIMESLSVPFTIAGQELFVSCSIGVACAPAHGTDYDTLMRHADAAMYEAKT